MKRYNRVYRILSIANAVVQVLLAVFLVVVGFLPFCENKTFYQTYDHAWVYLLIPFAAAVFAALAVKRPLWSLGSLLLTGVFFFVCVLLPYLAEAAVVGFASIGVVQMQMSLRQQGFTLMCDAVNILFWDIAFALCAVATVIARAVYVHKLRT